MTSLRLVARALAVRPAFIIAATLTLAVSVALATTTFAMLDAVWHPLVPYADADRTFIMWGSSRTESGQFVVSERFAMLRQARTLAVAAAAPRFAVMQHGDAEWSGSAAAVTANLFTVLGVQPVIGRVFHARTVSSDDAGAVIAWGVWQHRFGGTPLRDAAITIDGRTYPVIGVVPDGVDFPYRTDAWIPLDDGVSYGRLPLFHFEVARVRRGATMPGVQAELRDIARRLDARYGPSRAPWFMTSKLSGGQARFEQYQLALGVAGAIVLLIACANLAELALARSLVRRPEFALRAHSARRRPGSPPRCCSNVPSSRSRERPSARCCRRGQSTSCRSRCRRDSHSSVCCIHIRAGVPSRSSSRPRTSRCSRWDSLQRCARLGPHHTIRSSMGRRPLPRARAGASACS